MGKAILCLIVGLAGYGNLGMAFVYGVIHEDYAHGTFNLVIALACLYNANKMSEEL